MRATALSGRRRGFALPDLLAMVACGIIVAALTPPVLTGPDGRPDDGEAVAPEKKTWPSRRTRMRDGAQLKQIHQAFLVFSKDYDGVMPTPGLIRRLPIVLGGEERRVPGRGEEDVLLNTTANLYTAMIMQNYFMPNLLISSWDRNPHVELMKDYNYEKYDPVQARYWDDAFQADLAKKSNVSYAHLLLHGERKVREWRDTMNPEYVALSNRGPRDGVGDPKSHTCDDEGQWQGNVVFNDNATSWRTSMTKADVVVKDEDGGEKPDNFFAIDDGLAGRDIILTFTREMKADGPVIQHD